MNNAEYRAFNNYAQELSKLQIENAMLKKKLEDVKEISTVCKNNDFELCCTCKYADKCRKSDEEYSSYDVAKYILEIIGD